MKKTQYRVILVSILVALLGTGCQWVKQDQDAAHVALVKPALVSNCQRLGRTVSKVTHKVGVLRRHKSKVADELITMARNQAVAMKGDTIASEGLPVEGQQAFGVYRCRR